MELQPQIEGVEVRRFCFDYGLESGRAALNPHKLGQLPKQHSRELRGELSQRQGEVRMLVDAAATKRWLKQQRQLLRKPAYRFDPFL
ncbi:hypothetical protein [Variovorax boronicumulans]